MFGNNKMKRSDIEDLVAKTAQEAVKKYKAELLAQEQGLLDVEIQKLKSQIARSSWNAAQKWCKWDGENGPVLMPDRTRLYYRKGDTEIVLQEYAPQVRHLKFEAPLLKKSSEDSTTYKDKVYSYSLALPYTNFLFRFKDGMMDNAWLTFCDRPLKNLEEQPKKPYLPNINNDFRICHGTTFDSGEFIKGNVTQQISYCMDLFWQTVFREEWSQNFWNCRTHFANTDPRLATFDAWQEATLDNSLFVVENSVQWPDAKEESYGSMIIKNFGQDTKDAVFQKELFDELSEVFVESSISLIKNKMDEVMFLDKDFEKKASQLVDEFVEKVGIK